jgi:hypothetical protein
MSQPGNWYRMLTKNHTATKQTQNWIC